MKAGGGKMKLLKLKFISAALAEAIDNFCKNRCKDVETCVESCPEEQKFIEVFQQGKVQSSASTEREKE